MKKKLLTLTLTLVCAISLAACSSGGRKGIQSEPSSEAVDTETESSEESTEAIVESAEPTPEESSSEAGAASPSKAPAKQTANVPTELSDDIYSFQVSINGTVHQFPMWYSDFEALGWTYEGDATQTLTSNEYTVAETWTKDGISIYTNFANLSMNTAAFTDCIVGGITLEKYNIEDSGWEIILPGGIQYGVSTKEDIIAAYGDPSSDYDGEMYYKMSYELDYYQSVSLYVYKESGVLEEIEIENIVELEGADNSISSEVPDIVKAYTAPDAVGDDLYQFNIELEGNLYTLPCPVSELLANGFKINESNSATEFAAGGFNWIELSYNNQTYRTIVHNFADYGTTAENCFLVDIKSSIHDPDYSLTIPCGIKRGDSEEELLKKLEKFNYEVETSSSFTYYEVYDPNGSKLDSFTIVTSEGEVVIIEASNSNKPEY